MTNLPHTPEQEMPIPEEFMIWVHDHFKGTVSSEEEYDALVGAACQAFRHLQALHKNTVQDKFSPSHLQDKPAMRWIEIDDWLPRHCEKVVWLMNGGGKYEGHWDEVEGRDWVYLDNDNGDSEAFAFSDFSHWLFEPQNT